MHISALTVGPEALEDLLKTTTFKMTDVQDDSCAKTDMWSLSKPESFINSFLKVSTKKLNFIKQTNKILFFF